jgi:Flp pilus assembly protein TadG
MNRVRAGEHGQALVELAFVIPLVVLFLFGIIDFGLALNQQNSDTNIANLAVREAAVVGTTSPAAVPCGGGTKSTLTDWVMCEAKATGAPTPTSICVADTASSTPSSSYLVGDPIKVEIQSSFNWLHVISDATGLNTTLGASATMRLEQGPSGTAATIPFFAGATTCSS